MISSANKIFQARGTLIGLRLALDAHGFPYDIYGSSNLKLPFTFTPDTKFGLDSQDTYVMFPLSGHTRSGYQFREARRAIANYVAILTPAIPTYDRFYIGFSVFGEPIF